MNADRCDVHVRKVKYTVSVYNEFVEKANRYWFPAKRYGWGWGPPQTWQGWAVFVVWLAVIAVATVRLMPRHLVAYLSILLAMIVLLLGICYVKGEPPAWRWGARD
ncbi:MAG: hypothetical protein QOF32_774 [Gammaproteobacteria bacterium]|nr:hypothetical protein [Gammaproteobacteria bacterium]